MNAARFLSVIAISAVLCTVPVASHAEQTFSATLSGGKSFELIFPMQDNTEADLNKSFDETLVSAAVYWEAFKYLSVYGKALYYTGTSNPDSSWDRDNQKWVDIDGEVELSGTWIGGGLMVNTNRDRLISAGLGLGYGYLDNPDDILNSRHGQYNVTADIRVNFSDRWSAVVGWDHLSNGRQMFKHGGKDSEFYPNNGRDFWTLGVSYRF